MLHVMYSTMKLVLDCLRFIGFKITLRLIILDYCEFFPKMFLWMNFVLTTISALLP